MAYAARRTPAVIVSGAHLEDEEPHSPPLGVLLEEVLAGGARCAARTNCALIVFDEVYGFLLPVATPKPMDLDRALSNRGAGCIGRLHPTPTERA